MTEDQLALLAHAADHAFNSLLLFWDGWSEATGDYLKDQAMRFGELARPAQDEMAERFDGIPRREDFAGTLEQFVIEAQFCLGLANAYHAMAFGDLTNGDPDAAAKLCQLMEASEVLNPRTVGLYGYNLAKLDDRPAILAFFGEYGRTIVSKETYMEQIIGNDELMIVKALADTEFELVRRLLGAKSEAVACLCKSYSVYLDQQLRPYYQIEEERFGGIRSSADLSGSLEQYLLEHKFAVGLVDGYHQAILGDEPEEVDPDNAERLCRTLSIQLPGKDCAVLDKDRFLLYGFELAKLDYLQGIVDFYAKVGRSFPDTFAMR
ncbi:MAG: hypothetical protein ABH879_06830 [archaeon]